MMETGCPICLQPLLQPVKIPCGHVFCYLCIKGSAFHRRRCPLCRGAINMNFFDRPDVIRSEESTRLIERINSDFVWYYEGRNGWWQYDDRTASEIETAFRRPDASCEVFIAGHIYVVDFGNMCQYRKNHSGRSRRIKRDSADLTKIGVAGIRLSLLLEPREASEGAATPDTDIPNVASGNSAITAPRRILSGGSQRPPSTPRPHPPSTSTTSRPSPPADDATSRNHKYCLRSRSL